MTRQWVISNRDMTRQWVISNRDMTRQRVISNRDMTRQRVISNRDMTRQRVINNNNNDIFVSLSKHKKSTSYRNPSRSANFGEDVWVMIYTITYKSDMSEM
jgi:hypothetical protein